MKSFADLIAHNEDFEQHLEKCVYERMQNLLNDKQLLEIYQNQPPVWKLVKSLPKEQVKYGAFNMALWVGK